MGGGFGKLSALSVCCEARCQSLAQRCHCDLSCTSASLAHVLCDGCTSGLGREEHLDTHFPDTFLHYLFLAFSPRSFFLVAALGMTVPSYFCQENSRFLPFLLQVRIHLCITRQNMCFRDDLLFGQSAQQILESEQINNPVDGGAA